MDRLQTSDRSPVPFYMYQLDDKWFVNSVVPNISKTRHSRRPSHCNAVTHAGSKWHSTHEICSFGRLYNQILLLQSINLKKSFPIKKVYKKASMQRLFSHQYFQILGIFKIIRVNQWIFHWISTVQSNPTS